jgi:predicted TIM-barrel fold metal-dependent hydrolase
VVISSDNHAGADLLHYKQYLAHDWHDEFDAWASTYSNPWEFLDPRHELPGFVPDEDSLFIGAASWHSPLNWSSAKRLAHMEADGVVAEVLFPNTAPPFMPTSVFSGVQPSNRADYERRWAGLQAHNRWLVDFCAEAPGRRAGVAQILLNDVDETVAEIRRIHADGLTGGILLPLDGPEAMTLPLYFRDFEPVWATCEELNVPIHRHSAIPGILVSERTGPGAIAIGVAERDFYNHRALAQFILSGIFDRYPKLRLVHSESGSGWVIRQLEMLDAICNAGRNAEGILTYLAPSVAPLSMLPSEYFARNCFLGATLMLPSEAQRRYEIGLRNIMWGVDYPHIEGTWPYSREALRHTFNGVPEDEIRMMVGGTAAEVYGFDLDLLQPIANRVGPTVAEVATPLERLPIVPDETYSPVFSALQVLEVERA